MRRRSLQTKIKQMEKKKKKRTTINKVIIGLSLFCALCWVFIFILIKFLIN